MSSSQNSRRRSVRPSLGEVLLAVAGAMATTTIVTATAAAVTLRAENKRQP